MKKILILSLLFCSLIGKAQLDSFVGVATVNKDTLFLRVNDPVSYKLAEVWNLCKDKRKPYIIYVSYDRLLTEYVKQNWALKPKEEDKKIN